MNHELKVFFPKKNDYPDSLSILKVKLHGLTPVASSDSVFRCGAKPCTEYHSSPLLRTGHSGTRVKKNSQKYFQLLESSASAYFETDFFTRYLFIKRFKKALELIKIENSLKTSRQGRDGGSRNLEILDAGCGIGFLLPILSQIAKKVWAIENAKHSLEYAKFMCKKREIKNVKFKLIDLETPKIFTDNKFDLIVCLSVLEHIKNLDKTLSFFAKILKKEGSLIVGFPNEDNFIFKLFQTLEKKLFRPKVFSTLKGSKLVHVSKAHQINRALEKYFINLNSQNINIIPGISFYIIKKCTLKG